MGTKVEFLADLQKNTYIININVTNKQKEKYYHEYVPDLLDVRGPHIPPSILFNWCLCYGRVCKAFPRPA